MRTTLTYMVALVGLLAVGHARADEAEEPASAFGPGEELTYKVKYLGLTAGTAVVTVGDAATEGKPVWPITTVARSASALFPLKDRVVTYWDVGQSRTVSTQLNADENHKRRTQRIELDHEKRTARVVKQKEGEAATETNLPIEPGTLDVAAVTFALREKALEVGRSYTLPVFTGTKSFTLKATVEKRQRLKTRLGEREVFKLRIQTGFSGKFQARHDMFAYVTTDSHHVPVRIEADFLLGTIVAELTDYRQGRVLAILTPPGL